MLIQDIIRELLQKYPTRIVVLPCMTLNPVKTLLIVSSEENH